jgi:hypothetical protein
LDQRLDRARIRFVALVLLAVSLVLLGISFATARRGQTVFGPPLGADFAGFYAAGTILNQPDLELRNRLYDTRYHDEVYHELLPSLKVEEKLPYVYPPFVALGFQLLARLPYEAAFACWLVISAGLYLAGLALTWRWLAAGGERDWLTTLLLGLSFEPFLMECWLGGQLSPVGFFWVAAALAALRAQRPALAGLALGFCLYKPTLLVLLLPMLVVARYWRMLAGFGLTGLGLAALSFLGAGRHNCLEYSRVLVGFTRTSTGGEGLTGGRLALRLWKYVDLNAFFQLLLGGTSLLGWLLILLAAVAPLYFLVRTWWRLDGRDEAHRQLVWAATLTWTLVLNLYVAVYDTILALLTALLTAGALRRRRESPAYPPTFRGLMLLLYLVPWVTQPLARATGFQLFTVVLAAIATYELTLARRPPPAGQAKEPSPCPPS